MTQFLSVVYSLRIQIPFNTFGEHLIYGIEIEYATSSGLSIDQLKTRISKAAEMYHSVWPFQETNYESSFMRLWRTRRDFGTVEQNTFFSVEVPGDVSEGQRTVSTLVGRLYTETFNDNNMFLTVRREDREVVREWAEEENFDDENNELSAGDTRDDLSKDRPVNINLDGDGDDDDELGEKPDPDLLLQMTYSKPAGR